MSPLNSLFIKQTILSNWNLMRFLRLGLGITILVHSIIASNWIMGILSIGFTALPIFNIGCCGTTGCNTPKRKSAETTEDTLFEEVV